MNASNLMKLQDSVKECKKILLPHMGASFAFISELTKEY